MNKNMVLRHAALTITTGFPISGLKCLHLASFALPFWLISSAAHYPTDNFGQKMLARMKSSCTLKSSKQCQLSWSMRQTLQRLSTSYARLTPFSSIPSTNRSFCQQLRCQKATWRRLKNRRPSENKQGRVLSCIWHRVSGNQIQLTWKSASCTRSGQAILRNSQTRQLET